MGQTLTHGVYLPDEGERNCYSGLAANWQLLDGAVGTVAEHTTQIAGKAPAVHTHTKADITDFPAYGNAAGTICEGNDSRLSDARTPVAHTHTKADVTDLLNSNFIPSANNSYDLGSSSYQWNNLYAKRVNTQSVNGVNPGALSLPDYSDTTYIDISGSIVPPSGQTTINYSGGENQYTPPVDGWLSIRCDGATFLQIYRNAYNCPGTTASRQDASGKLVVTLPVLKNKTYTIKINTSGTTNVFQLYPCLGNV